MSHSTYKVGEAINFRARINGDPTTDNPTVTILDETDAIDSTLTIGSGLTQVGSTKIVKGSFTPDNPGVWTLHLVDDQGLNIIKEYPVGDFDLNSIGANVATNEAKLDAALAAIAAIDTSGGGHFG